MPRTGQLPPGSLLALLVGLPLEKIIALIGCWLPARVSAGNVIHDPSDPGQVLYAVRAGRVALAGDERLRTLGPGALLGQMPVYGYSLDGLALTAATDVELWLLSRVAVDQLRRDYPPLAHRLPLVEESDDQDLAFSEG